jgi:predicted RNA-binding Zn ribbon-like protein
MRMAGSQVWRDLIVVPRRDLCFEFANTLAWRGSTPSERLDGLPDLLAWLASNKVIPARTVAELRRWFDAHPANAATVFSKAIEIREAIYRMLRSIAAGSDSASEDLRLLNHALGEVAPRANLGRDHDGYGWRIEVTPTVAGTLAPVLWSAADMLADPDRARVRECSNGKCLWLFFDNSKNGSRRWCSMESCGNRAKAHRHYLRQKRN